MAEHTLRMGKEQTGTQLRRYEGGRQRYVPVFGTWATCSCNEWRASMPGAAVDVRIEIEKRWQKHVEEA